MWLGKLVSITVGSVRARVPRIAAHSYFRSDVAVAGGAYDAQRLMSAMADAVVAIIGWLEGECWRRGTLC